VRKLRVGCPFVRIAIHQQPNVYVTHRAHLPCRLRAKEVHQPHSGEHWDDSLRVLLQSSPITFLLYTATHFDRPVSSRDPIIPSVAHWHWVRNHPEPAASVISGCGSRNSVVTVEAHARQREEGQVPSDVPIMRSTSSSATDSSSLRKSGPGCRSACPAGSSLGAHVPCSSASS
jgi:hypothetical protein